MLYSLSGHIILINKLESRYLSDAKYFSYKFTMYLYDSTNLHTALHT